MSNSEQNGTVAAATTPRQVQLTVSGVQNDLKNGLSRPMIQAKYNLSSKDLKDLFSHPSLKGLKTKVAPGFILIDDTVEETLVDVPQDSFTDVQPLEETEEVEEIEVTEEIEVVETEEVFNEVSQPSTPTLEPWEQDLSVSESLL